MECSAYREVISARIDGEAAGPETAALDAHLATCLACRSWAETATAVTRSTRLGLAEPVPDLTNQIMARLGPHGPRAQRPHRADRGFSQGRPLVAPPAVVARLGLLLVAGAQLCLAIPALLGNDAGATIHVAHEQGSWLLAVAVGFLLAAVRPARATAMLPVIAALAAGLAITMAVDIAAGRTQAAAEAPHGLAFLGLGLLWLLTREIQYPRASGLARPA